MLKKHIIKLVGLLFSLTFMTATFADAPVVDITQGKQSASNTEATNLAVPAATDNDNATSSNSSSSSNSNSDNDSQSDPSQSPAGGDGMNVVPMSPDQVTALPLPQRVMRLEQQLNNLARMNLPQQISDLQSQVQQLSGQLSEQEHELKVLNKQQRSFYQDLDTRINQIKSLNSNDNGSNGDDNSNNNNSSNNNSKSNSAPPNIKLQDSSSYNRAFDFLRHKDYAKAQQGFRQYLSDFPNGAFLANAHYWMGEINLMQKHLVAAEKQFSVVVKKFSHSSKVPDAKLKLAIISAAQGDIVTARSELHQIRQDYPNSTAAQLASIQLQQIAASRSKVG